VATAAAAATTPRDLVKAASPVTSPNYRVTPTAAAAAAAAAAGQIRVGMHMQAEQQQQQQHDGSGSDVSSLQEDETHTNLGSQIGGNIQASPRQQALTRQQQQRQQQSQQQQVHLELGKELVRQWVNVLEQSGGGSSSSTPNLFDKTTSSVLNPLADSKIPSLLISVDEAGSPSATAACSGLVLAGSGPADSAAEPAGFGTKTGRTNSSTEKMRGDRLTKASRIKRVATAIPHYQQQQQQQQQQSPRSTALDGVRAAVAALRASGVTTANKRLVPSVTPLSEALLAGPAQPVVTTGAAAAAAAQLRDPIDVAAEAANMWSGASSPASLTCLPLPPFGV
jgi:hypothetical protein